MGDDSPLFPCPLGLWSKTKDVVKGGGGRGKKSVLNILANKLFRTIRVGVNPTRSSTTTPTVRLPLPLRIASSCCLLLAPRRSPRHPALRTVTGAGRGLSRQRARRPRGQHRQAAPPAPFTGPAAAQAAPHARVELCGSGLRGAVPCSLT